MRAAGLPGRVDAGIALAVVVAAVVFWVAFDDASYELAGRATLGIAIWWAVFIGLALQLLAPRRLPPAALWVGGLVLGLALWTLVSSVWAPSVEASINEFNRVSVYLGVYVLVVLAARRGTVGRWADGLAVAIASIGAVALASRLFPELFSDRELATFLPSAATRLSFPLGYWNGLGIFLGLGLPLLLRLALVARSPLGRGLALAPIPALAGAVFLTSSRGGVATALVGTTAFVALTERRWSAIGAVIVSGAGAVAVVAALVARDELVNGPLGTPLVRDQGRSAALLVALACVGTGLAYGLACRWVGGRIEPPRLVGRIAIAFAVVGLAVAMVVADPVDRFREFKIAPPESEAIAAGDFVTAHLLSGSGSGRWQFWSAAADQWREHPVGGEGAGSYEHWWSEHASFSYFLRDAHSLYLEALGELGPIGLLLIVLVVVIGIVAGVRRSLRSGGDERVTIAALTAVFAAFAGAAAIDWIWELTAVSVVGFTVLALVTGPATEPYEQLRGVGPGESPRWTTRRRIVLGVLMGAVAWVLLSVQVVPLLGDSEIARSRAAAERGDLTEASAAARSARDIEPWAATPYLQLALVAEQAGALTSARDWVDEAIDRDPRDWQLWLVSARLETKLGRISAANRSLRRAAELNPRSPLFKASWKHRHSPEVRVIAGRTPRWRRECVIP